MYPSFGIPTAEYHACFTGVSVPASRRCERGRAGTWPGTPVRALLGDRSSRRAPGDGD
jgi:hypothetical protein